MTPLQIGGYSRLAIKQKARDMADMLSTFAMGSRADGKDLKATLKDLAEHAERD